MPALMTRGTFLKTLRDQRGGILGCGVGMGIVALMTAEQYPQLLAGGGDTRAEQIDQITQMTRAFQVASGKVVTADTVGGYVTGRALGVVALVLSLWAVAAVITALRGDEDAGALDALTAGPSSRASILLRKLAGVWAALIPACLLIWLGLWAGYYLAGEPMPIAESLLAIGNCALIAALWASVGSVVAQFLAPRRKASWAAIALVTCAFFLNNILQGSESLRDFAWATPWYLYFRSMPLATGHAVEWEAVATLASLAILTAAAGAALFTHRDLGYAPSKINGGSAFMLGSVWGRAMREQLGPALLWGSLLGGLSAIFASTIKEGLEPLRKITMDNPGWLTQVLGELATPEAYLQVGILLYTQVVPVLFGITVVMAWAGDEEEGRLELQMALPRARHQELLARFLALPVGLACIVTLGLLGTLAGASAFGVQLDTERVALAVYAAGLHGAVIATVGITIATFLRRPGIAVGVMVALVAGMYFYNLFSTLWDIPEALRNLSIFHLYGQPLTAGLNEGNMAALAGVSVIAALLAIVGLRRRDIAR